MRPVALAGTLVVAPMWYRAGCSVFHPPIFMISSTAVPADDLRSEPPPETSALCSGPAASLHAGATATWQVIRSADNTAMPRVPLDPSTGNKKPSVKSRPIPSAAEIYSVTPRNAQVSRHCVSANTTAASTGLRSVFPTRRPKTSSAEGSRRTCDPKVKDRLNHRLME